MIKTLLDQLSKNAKKAPGWIPLVFFCYFLWFAVLEHGTVISDNMNQHKALIITSVALLLYVVGDALDKAVFPRENKQGGWKWLTPASLEDRKRAAKKALLLKSDYYRVSKALAESAGMYSGSWIQVKNELAKFFRSIVIPIATLGIILIFQNRTLLGIIAVIATPLLLLVYGRLKAWHMCDLYKLTEQFSKKKGFTISELDGVQLYFWEGKLVSSGIRFSDYRKSSEKKILANLSVEQTASR